MNMQPLLMLEIQIKPNEILGAIKNKTKQKSINTQANKAIYTSTCSASLLLSLVDVYY